MDSHRARARQLRRNPTDAERLLWRKLRFWQVDGLKFRRQQALGPYIVDFVCLEKRLVIEVDGGQHAEKKRITIPSVTLGYALKISSFYVSGITMY
jgi:very-short-patch-repair endonuclease